MSNRDFFNINYGNGRYTIWGRLAEGHNYKSCINEAPLVVDEQIYLEAYDSFKIAKKRILEFVAEGEISQGIVVDSETEKIVWLTKEK